MEIQLIEKANIGPCMDVKAYRGRLYAIQNGKGYPRGRLCVLRPDLTMISTFEGIGNARQIEIVNDIAFVTAREDGLWIFDVSNSEPVLLCCYKTVEFATGIALYGNLAFVSCRVYGVQVLDVSNPRAPVHISLIRAGEIQSATVKDGILYCGAWGNMEVVVVDVRTPNQLIELCRIPLQGQGDGVCVHGNVLYAATGHKRRGCLTDDRNDASYQYGNGVEMFDVSNPSQPVRLAGTFFADGANGAVDMWEVSLYGNSLLVNNSVLGVYAVEPTTLKQQFHLQLPRTEEDGCDAVTGVTVLGNDVFVASYYNDLFAVRGLDVAEQAPNVGDVHISATPQPMISKERGITFEVAYQGVFPVLSVAETEELLALACNGGGVHLLDKQSLECKQILQTKGSAVDVKTYGDKLYVATGSNGVEIYQINGFESTYLGGFTAKKSIHQISISKSGRYVLAALGGNGLRMYDVQDPKNVKGLYELPISGVLYGGNLAERSLNDGTMIAYGHAKGMFYTNPERDDAQFYNVKYSKDGAYFGYGVNGEGIETDGEHIFYACSGEYRLLSCAHQPTQELSTMERFATQKYCTGLLSIQNGLMIACNKRSGDIWAINVNDIQNPQVLGRLEISGSPQKAFFLGERILVPAGVNGLLEIKIEQRI